MLKKTPPSSPNALLRDARRARCLMPGQLADLLGVGDSAVRSWELGLRTPSPELRQRLCAILQKTPEELGLPPLLPV